MRIVGRQHQLVRSEIFGEDGDRLLDRFERDEALALEYLAGPGYQAGVVHPDVIEMPIHAIDIARHPAGAAFDKGNAQARELRSEAHTSELQSLMRTSYAVFRLKT